MYHVPLFTLLKAIETVIEERLTFQNGAQAEKACIESTGPSQFNPAALVQVGGEGNCFIKQYESVARVQAKKLVFHLDDLKRRITSQSILPEEVLLLKEVFEHAKKQGMPTLMWTGNPSNLQAIHSSDELWDELKNASSEIIDADQLRESLAYTGVNVSEYKIICAWEWEEMLFSLTEEAIAELPFYYNIDHHDYYPHLYASPPETFLVTFNDFTLYPKPTRAQFGAKELLRLKEGAYSELIARIEYISYITNDPEEKLKLVDLQRLPQLKGFDTEDLVCEETEESVKDQLALSHVSIINTISIKVMDHFELKSLLWLSIKLKLEEAEAFNFNQCENLEELKLFITGEKEGEISINLSALKKLKKLSVSIDYWQDMTFRLDLPNEAPLESLTLDNCQLSGLIDLSAYNKLTAFHLLIRNPKEGSFILPLQIKEMTLRSISHQVGKSFLQQVPHLEKLTIFYPSDFFNLNRNNPLPPLTQVKSLSVIAIFLGNENGMGEFVFDCSFLPKLEKYELEFFHDEAQNNNAVLSHIFSAPLRSVNINFYTTDEKKSNVTILIPDQIKAGLERLSYHQEKDHPDDALLKAYKNLRYLSIKNNKIYEVSSLDHPIVDANKFVVNNSDSAPHNSKNEMTVCYVDNKKKTDDQVNTDAEESAILSFFDTHMNHALVSSRLFIEPLQEDTYHRDAGKYTAVIRSNKSYNLNRGKIEEIDLNNSNFIAVCYAPDGSWIPPENLRCNIFQSIKNNGLEAKIPIFEEYDRLPTPEKIKFERLRKAKMLYKGRLHLINNQGQGNITYPLVLPFSKEDLLSIRFYNNQNKIENDQVRLLWCEKYQQHYIRHAKHKTWPDGLYCEYFVKYRSVVTQKKVESVKYNIEISKTSLLTWFQKRRIKKKLRYKKELSFLFDDQCPLKEKISRLNDYIRAFHADKKIVSSSNSDCIDFTLDALIQQAGVCQHRAAAFMLIAHYFNIPVHLIANGLHVFCELPFMQTDVDTGKSSLHWVNYDLGGGDGPIIQNLSEEIARHMFSTGGNDDEDEDSSELLSYNNIFDALKDKQALEKWEGLDISRPSLILHTAVVTPQMLYLDFLATREDNERASIFYVDTPQDFVSFLAQKRMEAGQISMIPGPLRDYIEEGKPFTLVINWNNFSEIEKIKYKCVMDAIPTLDDFPLPSSVRVIGFLNQSYELCDSFSSRCKQYEYKKTCEPSSILSIKQAEYSTEVNLEHRFDWQTPLFFSNLVYLVSEDRTRSSLSNQHSLIEGILSTGGTLKINNPPKDNPEFDLFYFRFMKERKVFFNGRWIDLKEHSSSIILEETPIPDYQEQIFFVTEKVSNESLIPVSANSFYRLFEDYSYYPEGAIEKNNGMLSQVKEEDVFLLQGMITASLWQRLINEIKKNHPKKRFRFALAPEARIEDLDIPPVDSSVMNESHLADEAFANIIFTNDPLFYVKKFNKGRLDQVITLSPETTCSEILYATQLNKTCLEQEGLLSFYNETKPLLQRLRNGELVILQGSLSQEVYNMLKPYLRPNGRLFLNGQWETLSGHVILVMPEKTKAELYLNGEEATCIFYTWDHYEQVIQIDDRENFNKLRAFYRMSSHLRHLFPTLSPILEWSEYKIQHALSLLQKHEHVNFHKNNPLKSLLLYEFPKDSEEYAFLNVMGKYYFGMQEKKVDYADKLLALINSEEIDLQDIPARYHFKLLNCFCLNEIKELLGDKLDESILLNERTFPKLSDNAKNQLSTRIKEIIDSKIQIKTKNELKNQQVLITLLDQGEKLITLMGEEGAGKSHLIREVLGRNDEEYKLFELSRLNEWLNYQGDKKAILLLDEFNLVPNEHWHFLEKMITSPTEFPLQYIIATGNPRTFPNRHLHDFFQQASYTIWFSKPSRAELKLALEKHLEESVENNMNKNVNQEEDREQIKKVFYNTLLFSFYLINKISPSQSVSYRVLENMAQRINYLFKKNPYADCLDLANKAIKAEFLLSLPTEALQKTFLAELSMDSQPSEDKMFKVTDGFFLPETRRMLYETLCQDLDLRDEAINDPSIVNKQGVLIEGASGIGKSTLFEQILLSRGYQRADSTQTSGKRFYFIASSSYEKMLKQLITAFHEGAPVILEELNLYPEFETVLNQLLSGVDLEGKKADNRGFFVLASQNFGVDKGRQAQSRALRSRFHHLYGENYTPTECKTFAEFHHVKAPEAFVKAYLESGLNARGFFHAIKEVATERYGTSSSSDRKLTYPKISA